MELVMGPLNRRIEGGAVSTASSALTSDHSCPELIWVHLFNCVLFDRERKQKYLATSASVTNHHNLYFILSN